MLVGYSVPHQQPIGDPTEGFANFWTLWGEPSANEEISDSTSLIVSIRFCFSIESVISGSRECELGFRGELIVEIDDLLWLSGGLENVSED